VGKSKGIIVGNCDNLVIRENGLTAFVPITQNAFPGFGIRVFGWIGNLAIISRNRLRSIEQGIDFHTLDPAKAGKTWINSENQITD
jgi:hypothetical protein